MFTVLLSVYAKEDPKYLQECINSLMNQTVVPDEILILEDGPLTKELNKVISSSKALSKIIRSIHFEKNRGLGLVLADGVNMAKYKLIARMDSDDIADPQRFQFQLSYFARDPSLDIVGSNVTEFIEIKENIISRRVMPEMQKEILQFSKKRNPFAHPSIMFKKESVLKAGNYRDKLYCEDYDLWVRMIDKGANCYNIQKNLVHMRLSRDFFSRRGGIKYVKSIIQFKKNLLNIHYISIFTFLYASGATLIVGLIPNQIRQVFYLKYLRNRKTVSSEAL